MMSMPYRIGEKAMIEMENIEEELKNENGQFACTTDTHDHTYLNNVSKHDVFAICVWIDMVQWIRSGGETDP